MSANTNTVAAAAIAAALRAAADMPSDLRWSRHPQCAAEEAHAASRAGYFGAQAERALAEGRAFRAFVLAREAVRPRGSHGVQAPTAEEYRRIFRAACAA